MRRRRMIVAAVAAMAALTATRAVLAAPAAPVSGGSYHLTTSTIGGERATYGPLVLSGNIAIGDGAYQGDLVSGTSTWETLNGYEQARLDMSGDSAGHEVSGSCVVIYNPDLSVATPVYDLNCELSLDSAEPAAVALHLIYRGSHDRCDDPATQCWTYEAGWFAGA